MIAQIFKKTVKEKKEKMRYYICNKQEITKCMKMMYRKVKLIQIPCKHVTLFEKKALYIRNIWPG